LKLVGINGFKRSGKGETALILNEIWPDPEGIVYGIGFADKLKMLAALSIGLKGTPQELIGYMDEAKESWNFVQWEDRDHPDPEVDERSTRSFTGREYLQNMGTEAGRTLFGMDFWVDQVLPKPVDHSSGMTWDDHVAQNSEALDRMYPDVAVLALTDLRFENEAQRIKRLGGVIWEVVRPGKESDGHASEVSLPAELIDHQIHNDGSLDDLRVAVKAAMKDSFGC
jgi:hypothetical protein